MKKIYPLCSISTEDDEDIIFIEYSRNSEVDLVYAKQIVANRLEFTNGKNHYVIIDATNVKSVSTEAKNYLLNPVYGTKNMLGSAMIATNPVSALLANIFIKSTKEVPSKFFSKKTDALKWIKELKVK